MSFLRRGHATLLVLSRLRRERRVPYLEPDRIAALRDARVRAAVGHAATFVPYYRGLFNREGLDPREIRTADDLARLPLVTKADLQQDPASFVSEHRAARAGIRLRTSGSTGMPLDVWHDRESLLANIAFAERERELEARLAGSRLGYRVLELGHRSTPGIPIDAFYSRETLRPFRPALARMLVSEPLECVVDALNRLRPDVVRGYGTYLEALFRKIDASFDRRLAAEDDRLQLRRDDPRG